MIIIMKVENRTDFEPVVRSRLSSSAACVFGIKTYRAPYACNTHGIGSICLINRFLYSQTFYCLATSTQPTYTNR
jgi:hypothetical protein